MRILPPTASGAKKSILNHRLVETALRDIHSRTAGDAQRNQGALFFLNFWVFASGVSPALQLLTDTAIHRIDATAH
jgi:hypothetical protein